MKKTSILLLLVCVIAAVMCLPAFGEQLSNYELTERVKKLEEKVGLGDLAGSWFDRITISGVVEVEASFEGYEAAGGDDEESSDLSLATVELGVDAIITQHVSGHVLFLYEDGEDICVDEGFILLEGGDELPLYLKAGEFYLPFGNFESNMISDPLTLEMGETRETALEVGFENAGFYGGIYGFNGDVDEEGEDSEIDNFGLMVGYGTENDAFCLDVGVGYINNLTDSDGLSDALDEMQDELDDDESLELRDYVDGINVHAILGFGPVIFIGEYTASLDDIELNYFDGTVDTVETLEKLNAWNLEVGYTFTVGEKEVVIALGCQGTDNMGDVLPETRILGSVGYGIFENTALALEYLHDEYENDDEADVITAQLAIEF